MTALTVWSHAATIIPATSTHGPQYLCDCGEVFPAEIHPAEEGLIDSEAWEWHVHDTRTWPVHRYVSCPSRNQRDRIERDNEDKVTCIDCLTIIARFDAEVIQ